MEARDEVRPSAWVAGSISTLNFGVLPTSLQTARKDYRDQAEIMAGAGADLIILEMMRDVELTDAAVDAVRAVDLPCWVGYSVEYDAEGRLVSQEQGIPLQAMLASLDFGLVQAVGVMHSLVEPTGPALEEVAVVWPGPRFAYAHSGGWSMPHWHFDDIIAPDAYAEVAATWVADGVQAVGGLLRFRSRTHPRLGKGVSVVSPRFDPATPARYGFTLRWTSPRQYFGLSGAGQ